MLKDSILGTEFQASSVNVRAGVFMNLENDLLEKFKEY